MISMIKHIFLIISCYIFCLSLLHGQIKSGAYSETHIPKNGFISVFGSHSFKYMNGEKAFIKTERGAAKSYLIFSEKGQWSDASSDGYVDGYVKTFKKGSFVFPIGDQNYYRPLRTSNSEEVSAAYIYQNPSEQISTNLDISDGLKKISQIEYWNVLGQGNTKLSLSWDVGSEIEKLVGDDIARLTIVGFDGIKWRVISSQVDEFQFDFSQSEYVATSKKSELRRGSISTKGAIDLSEYQYFTIGSLDESMITKQLELTLYPNPAVQNNFVYVNYAFSGNSGGEIMLTSMEDNSVYVRQLEGQNGRLKISTDDMKSGIYWVMLQDDKGRSKYSKLIIVDSGNRK